MAFLEVKDITKNFGETKVLKGVSFEMNKGEVVSIIGSSGNGKTTLLRCLNFLETPDGGETPDEPEEEPIIYGEGAAPVIITQANAVYYVSEQSKAATLVATGYDILDVVERIQKFDCLQILVGKLLGNLTYDFACIKPLGVGIKRPLLESCDKSIILFFEHLD